MQRDSLGVRFGVFICSKALVQLSPVFVKNFDALQWLQLDAGGLPCGGLAGLHLDIFRFDQVFYEPLRLGGIPVRVQARGEGVSRFLAE